LELPVTDRVINNNGANARGRLTHCGPQLAPFPPTDITFTAWCPGSSELRLTPQTRRAHHWGTRRQHRYVTLANAAADELVSLTAAPRPCQLARERLGSRPELPLRGCRRAGGRIGRLCRTRLVRPLGL
jgi:hypothetical protein